VSEELNNVSPEPREAAATAPPTVEAASGVAASTAAPAVVDDTPRGPELPVVDLATLGPPVPSMPTTPRWGANEGEEEEIIEEAPAAPIDLSNEPEEPASTVVRTAAPKPAAGPRRERRKAEALEPAEPAEKSQNMNWYILKVQSNREESIRQGLQRRVRIAGLDRFFGRIIVPIEKVTEFKGGKKRVVKRKLYPGYLVVQMEINEEAWFLVRETPGIGDFTGGAGHPTPMLPHEVAKIEAREVEKPDEAPKLKINFNTGDRVKINEGTFENFEGEVDNIDQTNGRVTVMINIFGRSTPVELEYWQIEAV